MVIKESDGKATFIFDQETDSPVYLGGDFNNWDYSEDPLTFVDGKWQLSKKLSPGAYQFKYVTKNGEENWFNDWRADAYTRSAIGCDNSVVIIDN